MPTRKDRRPVVAGNWKMHKTAAEAQALARELRNALGVVRDQVEVVLAPPFTALYPVGKALEDSNLYLAAQNCHAEAQGAFTGEVSAPMLKDVGCRYVILGHSERRQLFGETDEGVNRKVKAVFAAGLLPIVCVGETLQEREGGRTLEVVSRQLAGGLAGLDAAAAARAVIAYEPVWAIGTGKTATSAQAQEVHAHIRGWVAQAFGKEVAAAVRIQYGGSVKPDNAAELLGQPDVDGALVGGASLKAADFAAIVKAAFA
ncbi:MAG: triose-phosphate isomerase [Deltaproteobacteria bacterium]|nr:triose-phosphate isomerase [Deltaproteobacteria bacterium]